jgi:hypothetical protein
MKAIEHCVTERPNPHSSPSRASQNVWCGNSRSTDATGVVVPMRLRRYGRSASRCRWLLTPNAIRRPGDRRREGLHIPAGQRATPPSPEES